MSIDAYLLAVAIVYMVSNFCSGMWFYKTIRIYKRYVIWYEKTLKNPYIRLLKSIYSGAIMHVTKYDTLHLTATVEYTKSVYNVMCDILLYVVGQQHLVKKFTRFVPSLDGIPEKHPLHIVPIYQVRCWDGRQYFTRGTFDIKDRVVSSKRHVCLHASINDVYDITEFINMHPCSFTGTNNITLIEIICMLLTDNKLSTDAFYMLLEDDSKYMYVIDDETLEVRTYKDNQPIVL